MRNFFLGFVFFDNLTNCNVQTFLLDFKFTFSFTFTCLIHVKYFLINSKMLVFYDYGNGPSKLQQFKDYGFCFHDLHECNNHDECWHANSWSLHQLKLLRVSIRYFTIRRTIKEEKERWTIEFEVINIIWLHKWGQKGNLIDDKFFLLPKNLHIF